LRATMCSLLPSGTTMDPRLLALGALLCLTAPATGQGRTWIVDGNNGPGTNFLDIPPAVAAAQDGDTILVRPFGSFFLAYRGAVITKAIRLISEGGTAATVITSPASTQGYLVIKEIPANKTVVVEGVGTSFFV